MPTLRSAMYAGYNKFDDAKVRIGSWREELALKELTGVTRLAHPKNKAVFNATGVRVLYHTDRSGGKDSAKSISNASFINPESVPATKDRSAHNQPGPRSVRSKQTLMEIVKAEEAERATHDADKKKEGSFDTTFRQSFVRYSDDASRKARPESFKPGGDRFSQNNPKALIAGHGGDDEKYSEDKEGSASEANIPHYGTGKTLTLWNTGGIAPNKASAQGTFGRSSIFTEPGVHPSFFQEVYPYPAPHHPILPVGLSDLEASSLMFLKRRVVERARGEALPSIRGLWRLLWPQVYSGAAGKMDPRDFRQGMAMFEVPVTPHELWAATTAFDTDKSGQISLDKVMRFFRDGALSPSRREMVVNTFQRLDPNFTGAVRLDRIRESCDFSNSLAVTSGRASEDTVVEAFLQHFSQHGKRSEGDDEVTVAVTLEGFQEAFHDIGAAFMLVGERFRGTAAAVGNKSTGVSCDAEEDDDCFRSLVASLG